MAEEDKEDPRGEPIQASDMEERQSANTVQHEQPAADTVEREQPGADTVEREQPAPTRWSASSPATKAWSRGSCVAAHHQARHRDAQS